MSRAYAVPASAKREHIARAYGVNARELDPTDPGQGIACLWEPCPNEARWNSTRCTKHDPGAARRRFPTVA